MPWRTAPGLAGFAAALDVDHDVERRFVVGELERLRMTMRPVSRGEEFVGGFSLTTIVPVPFLRKTRATALLRRPGAVVVVADHGSDIQCLGLLRRMRMLAAGIAA
jgi:hypothetical protein